MAGNKRPDAEDGGPPARARLITRKFDDIRRNPKADWDITDIETACRQLGMRCSAPKRGSHHKIGSDLLPEKTFPIPHRRPIKIAYIRTFITLAQKHIEAAEGAAAGSREKRDAS